MLMETRIADLIGSKHTAEQIATILAAEGTLVQRRSTYFSVEDEHKRRFAVYDSPIGTRLTALI